MAGFVSLWWAALPGQRGHHPGVVRTGDGGRGAERRDGRRAEHVATDQARTGAGEPGRSGLGRQEDRHPERCVGATKGPSFGRCPVPPRRTSAMTRPGWASKDRIRRMSEPTPDCPSPSSNGRLLPTGEWLSPRGPDEPRCGWSDDPGLPDNRQVEAKVLTLALTCQRSAKGQHNGQHT